jgi:hypothetical protein
MANTRIHSLTPLCVNVDVNFAQPRPHRAGVSPSLFYPLLQTFVSGLVKGAQWIP